MDLMHRRRTFIFDPKELKQMKPRNSAQPTVKHLNAVVLIASLVIVAAVVAAPLYSVHSNSLTGSHAAPTSKATSRSRIGDAVSRYAAVAPLAMLLQTGPIKTYAAGCTTEQSKFNLGDVICVKTTGEVGFRLSLLNPTGFTE